MFNEFVFYTNITFFGLAFFVSHIPHFVFKNVNFRILYSGVQLITAIIAVMSVLLFLGKTFSFKQNNVFCYILIIYSVIILSACVFTSAYILIKNIFQDYETSAKTALNKAKKAKMLKF